MSRSRSKVKRSASKKRRLERRAQQRVQHRRIELAQEPIFRYLMNLRWAQEREAERYEWDAGVVCETCGLEQPFEAGSGCNREGLLEIPCSGVSVVTHDHYRELA